MYDNKYQLWQNKVFLRPPPREDRWECELQSTWIHMNE